jgi:hypothetical protein
VQSILNVEVISISKLSFTLEFRYLVSGIYASCCWTHDLEWNELVGEWMSEWGDCCRSGFVELLQLEGGSWELGIVWEPRVRGTSTIGSCCQTMNVHTADWKDLNGCCSELQNVN